MIYVGLEKGKILVHMMDDKKAKDCSFKRDDWKGIGNFLVKHGAWKFITSSSCNHPEEYGFPRSFDVGTVLRKAVEYACDKLATHVEPGTVQQCIKRIEAAVKGKKFPVPVKMLGAGKNGENILWTFTDTNDYMAFMSGMKYSANLLELRRKSRSG